MLSLQQLAAPAHLVKFDKVSLRLAAPRIGDWAAWESYVRRAYIDATERQTRDLSIDERAAIVLSAREHAATIEPSSPESAEALAAPQGQLAFAAIIVHRHNPDFDTDILGTLLSPEELRQAVNEVLALDLENSPDLPADTTPRVGPVDFGPIVCLLAKTYGFLPSDIEAMTWSQLAECIDSATGDGRPRTYKDRKTGKTMRRFANRAEAEAFLAEQRANNGDRS